MSDLTEILEAIRQGDGTAPEKLLPLVYEQLRQVAANQMARERSGHTLQATALVHEAWLRLVGGSPLRFQNRIHFFAAAGEAMRRILVESARRRQRLKRGAGLQRVEFDTAVDLPAPMPDDELLALNEALDRLVALDERASEVVKLCFFVGLTQKQAATELGVSVSTVERLWTFARTWLFQEIRKEGGG